MFWPLDRLRANAAAKKEKKSKRVGFAFASRIAQYVHLPLWHTDEMFFLKKTNVQFWLYYAGIFRTVPKIWKGISRGAAEIRKRLLLDRCYLSFPPLPNRSLAPPSQKGEKEVENTTVLPIPRS